MYIKSIIWRFLLFDILGFHKLAKKHNWTRPNDVRALNLMNKAAKCVMKEFEDILMGYGQSDEYSFVFRRETEVHCINKISNIQHHHHRN